MDKKSPDHFEGLSAEDHLKQARLKGLIASTEIHGMEMPGHISAYADAMKDIAILLVLIWSLSFFILSQTQTMLVMILLSIGWCLWKPARSAMLGWGRLERLHRLIEEERWEVEHNRAQEKVELEEMYRSKGFSGKLLEEVIDTLMSDENRLLRIMLEEELGLTLGIHEHPLKSALGAFFGAFTAAAAVIFCYQLQPVYGAPLACFFLILLSAVLCARLERNKKTSSFVWHVAVACVITATVYMISKLFLARVG